MAAGPEFLHGWRNPLAGGALSRAPRLAEWALIALIAFLLAKAAIALFAPLPVPKGDRLAALPASRGGETTLVAHNPFPAAQAAPVAAEAGPDLEETKLDLTLTGVWPSENGGSAIIRKSGGEDERYAVGDMVSPGVRLVAVYSDQVVLEQNGVRESLRFENKTPPTRTVPQAPQQQQTQQQTQRPGQTRPEPAKILNAPAGETMLNGAFRIAPGKDEAGKPVIRIFAGRDRDAFEEVGFRDGDILRSINGSQPPTTLEGLQQVIEQFTRSRELSIIVERGGAQEVITLSKSGSGNE